MAQILIDSFIRYLECERRRSVHTLIAYRKDLDQFLCFGERMIEGFSFLEVDGFLVRSWIVHMMDEGNVPRTVRRKVSTLSSFFRFLMRDGLVEKNPCSLVVLPKVREKLPFFVGMKAMDCLFDSSYFDSSFGGLRDRAVLSLFYGAGIRLSELVELEVRNVDFDRNRVKVFGKGSKERIIPIPEEVSFYLKEYDDQVRRKFGKVSEYFFLTDKGEQVYQKFVYRLVKRYLGKVTKIEKRSPHVLRHSYATHMLNGGADLNAVKELLGHASLAATQVYTHTSFEKLKQIYKQAHTRA